MIEGKPYEALFLVARSQGHELSASWHGAPLGLFRMSPVGCSLGCDQCDASEDARRILQPRWCQERHAHNMCALLDALQAGSLPQIVQNLRIHHGARCAVCFQSVTVRNNSTEDVPETYVCIRGGIWSARFDLVRRRIQRVWRIRRRYRWCIVIIVVYTIAWRVGAVKYLSTSTELLSWGFPTALECKRSQDPHTSCPGLAKWCRLEQPHSIAEHEGIQSCPCCIPGHTLPQHSYCASSERSTKQWRGELPFPLPLPLCKGQKSVYLVRPWCMRQQLVESAQCRSLFYTTFLFGRALFQKIQLLELSEAWQRDFAYGA